MHEWLNDELCGSIFKDKRLSDRFIKITKALAGNVGDTIPQACEHWSMAKATYRFLSNDRIEESEILKGHYERCAARTASYKLPESKVASDPKLEKRGRRELSPVCKRKFIALVDACTHGELGPLLRKSRLYNGQLKQWLEDLKNGGVADSGTTALANR